MNNAKLIIGSPEKNSSLIYAAGFTCLDQIIYLEINNKKIGWFPATEFEKAKIKASLDLTKNLSLELETLKKDKKKTYCKSSLVTDLLKENNIQTINVPEDFPSKEYQNLINNGFKINIIDDPFFKERISKKDFEIDYLKKNAFINSSVMKKVYDIIASSTVASDKRIKYNGEYLTSEFLQNFIIKTFIENDMISEKVIVSIGDQGCFPHEYGSGFIKSGESIIVDIFPKNRTNLYFTDMTRTFCKGRASEELKKMYNTVMDAQKIAFDKIKTNENGAEIHKTVLEFFISKGYKSGTIDGVLQGFFHGTGHGVGLECHEAPYISNNGTILENNSCVTVEPGLYYFGIGGVRIEDIVIVRDNGADNLTDFEKKLEIE